MSVLTPFFLVVGFFNDRRRLLHDILVGTVLINNARGRLLCGAPARWASKTAFDAGPRRRDANGRPDSAAGRKAML